jgi:hypothetical protein
MNETSESDVILMICIIAYMLRKKRLFVFFITIVDNG